MASTEKNTSAPKKGFKLWLRRILFLLLAVFILLQFFQPAKNNQNMDMTNDISTVVTVPEEVHNILKTSCYDCHSNNTLYPWYANIQPAGWWLKDHIDEGKKNLNFQDFATLQPRPGGRLKTTKEMQDHTLEEIEETVSEGEMPLKSYTLIHRDAILNDGQKKLIADWVSAARKELANKPDAAQ